MGRLGKTLLYLQVRHKAKWRYDVLYPVLLTLGMGTLLNLAASKINLSGDRGLLDQANSLIGILVGFFIAALAAVATFDRPSMDQPMAGVPPTLRVIERGVAYEIKLSRRIYLSQLFGYLTVASILTYGIGSVAQVGTVQVSDLGGQIYYEALRWIFVYFYTFLVSNIFVNTLLGVFYLSYRIHDLESKRV